MRTYKFNQHGVCIDPDIAWQGIYNTYGGRNSAHPLFGVSFVSIARREELYFFGYSVGTQNWMHCSGCGKSNGIYDSARNAVIAALTLMLAMAKDQMENYMPIPEEQSNLRSLITDIKKELVQQHQLSLF